MYSNWNVLTLPIKADGKYKIGDTYHVSEPVIRGGITGS